LALGAGTTYRFVFARFLNFRVLTWTEYTDHRRFPEWAMGYRDIHSAQGGDWEAVHRILEAARIGEQAADNVPLKLLARFGETMGFEAGGHEAGGYEEAGSLEVAA
jgi:hypothetical protein